MKKKNISYNSAVQYLFGLQKYGIKFGLSKTLTLLKAFGNPHRGQRYIHIGGSNGKGSVAAMVESILRKSGLKVGLYSSPHLVRFTERFRINGQEIDSDKAAALVGELMDAIDPTEPPTFFEVTTAMALIYFSREKTDVAIMEVGMGGRLDATNIITPFVSAITNISLEHQFFLGSRLMDIAREKAGIIKRGVDLVTGVSQPPVVRLFERIGEEKKAPMWRIGKEVRYRSGARTFNYYGLNHTLRGLEVGLRGGFQKRNAAVALAVTEIAQKTGLRISSSHMREGIRDPSWPGRMQIVSRKPLVMLDGAHNPAAIRELAKSIRDVFTYSRLILVMGVMDDKDIGRIVKGIIPAADYVIYTRPSYYRSAEPEKLMREASGFKKPYEVIPVISKAIERAMEMAHAEDMILICGSLFTVGEALTYFDPEKYRPDGI